MKCDEEKPACRRCIRAKRKCEGYPERRGQPTSSQSGQSQSDSTPVLNRTALAVRTTRDLSSAPQSDQSRSNSVPVSDRRRLVTRARNDGPQYSLIAGFRESISQDRLSRIGCSVISDGLRNQFAFGCETLEFLIPQLNYSLPSVNAAAAAVGAYYELQTSSSTDRCREQLAARQYQLAIKLIQQDLVTQPYGLTPLLVGSILLLLTELLLRRRQGALVHLRAAYKIMGLRKEAANNISNLMSDNNTSTDESARSISPPSEMEDDLETLFRSFDIQTAAYSDGTRSPDMQQSLVAATNFSWSAADDIQNLGRHVISEVHSSYHFTWSAVSLADIPTSFVPHYVLIEQGRHIGALKYLVGIIDHAVLPTIGLNAELRLSSKYTHVLMLRNICLSTLIYVSTILSPHETSFDSYADYFQQIITTAEIILDNLGQGSPNQQPPALKFTPSTGVIQPLYLTASKYRQPSWRRRAIRCLQRAGREGPWIGDLLAAVTERAADIEERDSGTTGIEIQDADLSVAIPEEARIYLCRMAENNGSLDGRLWLTPTRGVTKVVYYTRCRDAGLLEKKDREERQHEFLQFESGRSYKLLFPK